MELNKLVESLKSTNSALVQELADLKQKLQVHNASVNTELLKHCL